MPQTEAALMRDFTELLSGRLSQSGSGNTILLEEFGGVRGRPDLVAVNIRNIPQNVDRDMLALSLRSFTKSMILALLRHDTPRRSEYLERVTGLTRNALRRHVRQLDMAGIVEVRGDSSVALRCRLPWNMVEIISYEGKLANWGRAVHQALSYRGFSNYVWIVMPASAAGHAEKRIAPIFYHNGIGLIAVQHDGQTRIVIRGRRHRHPASRVLYLMAVGVVLERVRKQGDAFTCPPLNSESFEEPLASPEDAANRFLERTQQLV